MRLALFLTLALVFAAALSFAVGAGDLASESLRETFLRLRAARTLAAFVAGGALAVAGVLVQGLFRNPLASPSILGTTAGAVLGGNSALMLVELVFGVAAFTAVPAEMVVPVGCVLGAFLSLLVLVYFVRRQNDLLVLLLTGFILSALFVSIGSFLTSLAQESWELGRAVIAFSLGSVTGTGFRQISFVSPLFLAGVAAAFLWGRTLDVLASGEEEAASLGVSVRRVRVWVAVWVAVLTGTAVALGGALNFVGLVVPHLLRPFVGSLHRKLVPASALAGGVFVLFCDVCVRLVPSRTEVPLGVITALVGAPIFLVILHRVVRGGEHG
jgi:iron complex transport system permease protein